MRPEWKLARAREAVLRSCCSRWHHGVGLFVGLLVEDGMGQAVGEAEEARIVGIVIRSGQRGAAKGVSGAMCGRRR